MDLSNEIILRNIESSDTMSLIELARLCLHSERTDAFVQWKYYENPLGKIYGCCAEVNEEIIGFYGNIPLRLKIGERVITGVQASDSMVAPVARRQGLFVKMEDWLHSQIARSGLKLSYSIPNPISRAGHIKRMGWEYPGEIPRYVSILNPATAVEASNLQGYRALAYRIGLQIIQWIYTSQAAPVSEEVRVCLVKSIDERFDDLWERVSVNFSIAIMRDSTYLKWRYIQNPLIHYTILVAEEATTLRGYIILSHRDMGKRVMAVAEILTAPDDELAGLALLSAAKRYAREAGAAQIQCWMLPQHQFYTLLLQKSGFVFSAKNWLPGLFRYTASLIVKLSLGNNLSPDPRQLDNWYITMGDQDYY